MNKEKLIEAIEEMPDNIQVFVSNMAYDVVDIKIFLVPKDEEFVSWYFGP